MFVLYFTIFKKVELKSFGTFLGIYGNRSIVSKNDGANAILAKQSDNNGVFIPLSLFPKIIQQLANINFIIQQQ